MADASKRASHRTPRPARLKILYLCALGLVLLIAPLGVRATGRQSTPFGTPPVSGSANDPLDTYVLGGWHLALAGGRIACHNATLTPELRSLTGRDTEWVERGMASASGCGPRSRFATVQPIELDVSRLEDLQALLRGVRADYGELPRSSACWSGGEAARVAAMAKVVFAIGDAAAATACAIASWRSALPPGEAESVRRFLAEADAAAAAIPDRAVRERLAAQLNPLAARLGTDTGESIYHALVDVVDGIRLELRRKR